MEPDESPPIPVTRYAKSGEILIAYQVFGTGPIDLVFVPGLLHHIEHVWREPGSAQVLRRFASFARVIHFDKRGTGLSDPVEGVPTLEERMDDIRAVMAAASSSRAAIFGTSEGGALAALFAATYPRRTSHLILHAAPVRWRRDERLDLGFTEDQIDRLAGLADATWGEAKMMSVMSPGKQDDPKYVEWWSGLERLSASPEMIRDVIDANREIDVTDVLPVIRVPTLIIHRTGDSAIPAEHSRYAAKAIPRARLIELDGADHYFGCDPDPMLGAVEDFVTGTREESPPNRVLATVLFTDIVDSTLRAAEMGDRIWCELLDKHHAVVRRELARYRGREVGTSGDGFLAAFDGPARAIRCAIAVREAMAPLGLEMRAGLHTGECEVMEGGNLGGMTIHIGARVASLAEPGEILVSSTVKDLVAGSGLVFTDRGVHELKGVPVLRRMFRVS